jgi:hypothetical protein
MTRGVLHRCLFTVNDIDAADALIETWRYDPHTLSRGETVDPLSLHAQFWDHADERVAQAAVSTAVGFQASAAE